MGLPPADLTRPLPLPPLPGSCQPRHDIHWVRAEASQHNAQPQNVGNAVKLAAVGLAAVSLLHGAAPADAGVILTKREVKKVRLHAMPIH